MNSQRAEIGGDFEYGLEDLDGRGRTKVALEPLSLGRRNSYSLYVDSGRSALRHVLKQVTGCVPGDRVLLPGYLCSSVLKPFRELGLTVDFYAVDRQFRPQLGGLDSNYKVALAIDYFGFRVGCEAVVGLKAISQLVILDRSHSWLSERDTVAADVEVASLRKVVGIPDGGLVLAQRPLPPVIEQGACPVTAVRISASLLKQAYLRGVLPEKTHLKVFEVAEALWDESENCYLMSDTSHAILCRSDLSAIGRRRRDNFTKLLDGNWRAINCRPVFGNLPAGVVPLGFPIYCSDRDTIRHYLISNGVFPPVHWPIPVGCVETEETAWMAQHILTIPIDQRYDVHDMERILELVSRAGANDDH